MKRTESLWQPMMITSISARRTMHVNHSIFLLTLGFQSLGLQCPQGTREKLFRRAIAAKLLIRFNIVIVTMELKKK